MESNDTPATVAEVVARVEKKTVLNGQTIVNVFVKTEQVPLRERLKKSFVREYEIRDALKAQKPYDLVCVYVDSQGGSFRSVCGVVDGLRHAPRRKIRLLVDGHCGSAATMLLDLPGPHYITPRSDIYIHSCQTVTYKGNRLVSTKETKNSDLVNECMVDAYRRVMRRRLGLIRYLARRHLPEVWVVKGKRFSAEDAVKMGLLDEVRNSDDFPEVTAWSSR